MAATQLGARPQPAGTLPLVKQRLVSKQPKEQEPRRKQPERRQAERKEPEGKQPKGMREVPEQPPRRRRESLGRMWPRRRRPLWRASAAYRRVLHRPASCCGMKRVRVARMRVQRPGASGSPPASEAAHRRAGGRRPGPRGAGSAAARSPSGASPGRSGLPALPAGAQPAAAPAVQGQPPPLGHRPAARSAQASRGAPPPAGRPRAREADEIWSPSYLGRSPTGRLRSCNAREPKPTRRLTDRSESVPES